MRLPIARVPEPDRDLVAEAADHVDELVGQYIAAAAVVRALEELGLDVEHYQRTGERRPLNPAGAEEPASATLADTCDAVIMTMQPVARWADREGLQSEEARRDITALAAMAHAVDAQVEPELWRYRRGRRIDVRLRVVREVVRGARLAIVTSATWGPR